MSEETTVTTTHAVQRDTSTETSPHVFIRVTSQATPIKNQAVATNEEQLSPDILAFCALLARIVMRCLAQRDAHVLNTLSLSQRGKNKQE